MTSRGAWTSRGGVVLALAVALAVSAPGSAARAADDLPPAIDTVGARGARGPGLWQVSAGWRESLVRSAGYDPFSNDDVLTQFALTATRAFRTGRRFATAAGALWENGDTTASARGENAHLTVNRLGGLLEERFAPRPGAYAFVRVAPAWLHASAALADPASPASLETSFSTFGIDASGGVAGRLNPGTQLLGVWVVAEAGYGWAAAEPMALAPALPEADRNKAGVTRLDDLALRGALFRFAVALSY